MERIKSLNEIQKIKKIHYYVEQFMFIGEYHQLYDFETKSLFTKNIVEVDGNVDLDKEFEFVTTLDDEKINTFFITYIKCTFYFFLIVFFRFLLSFTPPPVT